MPKCNSYLFTIASRGGEINDTIENPEHPINNNTANPNNNGTSSKPLRTLRKLQAMLDDSDYTTSTLPRKLWTSQDRATYKRQQQQQQQELLALQRQAWQQQKQGEHQKQAVTYEDEDDTDSGYTLPNLPIYVSDGESPEFDPPRSPSSTTISNTRSSSSSSNNNTNTVTANHLPEIHNRQSHGSNKLEEHGIAYSEVPSDEFINQVQPPLLPQQPYHGYSQQQAYPPAYYYSSTNSIPVPPNHPMYPLYASHYATASSWGAASPPYTPLQPPYALPYNNNPQLFANHPHAPTNRMPFYHHPVEVFRRPSYFPNSSSELATPSTNNNTSTFSSQEEGKDATQQQAVSTIAATAMENNIFFKSSTSLAKSGTNLSFDSFQKLVFSFLGAVILSYCAVSPRTAPAVVYNLLFKENLKIVALVAVVPVFVFFLAIFDAKENDVNTVVSTFYNAFTMGYCFSFLAELILTTLLRLAVFWIWEPQVFDLTPSVPLVLLPWVLRENKYRPKRITLFAADFCTSCVASAFVEECMKLKMMQWSVTLPKNFHVVSNEKRKKKKMELNPQRKEDVRNVNTYVTHMMASSLGLKLADSIRRALMYTKITDTHKGFYALCRGIFPIHELCGTLTALQLAKRDVLGFYMPVWKIILPAVFLHGMANFRGMKPVFKWNSNTPWSEMQMSPWNMGDDSSTLFQIVQKGFAKFMWLTILGRVLGYCIKNYYMIARQAVKRTTSNRAAFSAEIEAAELLKKTKD